MTLGCRQYNQSWIGFRGDKSSQVEGERLGSPIFNEDGEDDEDGNGEQIVVEHRVPVFESGDLYPLSHKEDLIKQDNQPQAFIPERSSYLGDWVIEQTR